MPRSDTSLFRWIWLFPLAFVLHCLEEGPGFSHWVEHTLHGQLSWWQWFWNNVGFMTVLVTLCAVATVTRARWATVALFVWTAGQVFWNFVFHLYTEIHFDAYSPGLVTACVLYYPLYLALAYRALRDGYLSLQHVVVAMIAGATGLVLTIWIGLYQLGAFPLASWLPTCLH